MKIMSAKSASWILAAFAIFSVLASGRAQDRTVPSSNVPAQVQPPAGAALVLSAHGKGDQIYVCKKDEGSYSWALKGPDAQLLDKKGHVLGKHFAGPSWQLNDGSKVVAKASAHADSPDTTSVPWLLLTAVDHSGQGTMSEVEYIQRLNTKGGKAPSTGCDAEHEGNELHVAYSADYLFYRKR
jgi:hypothetical protein